MKTIFLGVEGMSIENLIAIARSGAKVQLTADAEKQIQKSRHLIERWVQDEKTIYGITTGFGALSDVTISGKDARQLQENILMSHASGVGDALDEEVVRAIMALRIKDLARGHSGIRLETVQHLITLLNQRICPVVANHCSAELGANCSDSSCMNRSNRRSPVLISTRCSL